MKLHAFLFLCLSLSATHTLADRSTSSGSIKEAEFIIKKEKKNELPEASRLFTKAPLPKPVLQHNQTLNYHLIDLGTHFSFLERKIKLLKAKTELGNRLYDRYIQLGYGYKYHPYVAFYLANTNHNKYTYGVQGKHTSMGKNSHLEAYDQAISVHGKWMRENFNWNGAIDYQGNKFALISQQDKDQYDVNQAYFFHRISLHTQLNNYGSDGLSYQVPLGVSYLRNQHNEQEKEGDLRAKLSYPIKDNLAVETQLGFSFSQYQLKQELARNRHIERFKPSLSLLIHDFKIQAGFNLVYQSDVIVAVKHLNLYPMLEINYQPFKWLHPYAGLGGDIHANTWHSLIADNPWLQVQPILSHANQSFHFYAGIKSYITAQIALHAGSQIGSYQNLPFYLNSHDDPRKFVIGYDPETSIKNVFGELTVNITNRLKTNLKGNYYTYTTKQATRLWHRPSHEVELSSIYNLYDKILFKSKLCWIGGLEALERTHETIEKLDDIVDISVRIDYLWNQRFSIFLDGQNLLNRKQSRYLNTPFQGFNLLFGISYSW